MRLKLNLTLGTRKSLAEFYSDKCPDNIILKTYDLMSQIRDPASEFEPFGQM